MAFKLAEAYVQFEKKDTGVIGGIHQIEGALEGLEKKAKGFKNIFELGLGLNVGAQIFGIIHNSATSLAGGFLEATQAGMGFWDSLGVGIDRLFGAESALDRLQAKTREQA